MIRRIIIPAILSAILSCASRPELELQPFPATVQLKETTTLDEVIDSNRQRILEVMISKNHVEHVADIIYYCIQNNERYLKALKEHYNKKTEEAQRLWDVLESKSDIFSGLALIPTELIGQNKDSILMIFPPAFSESGNLENLESLILDHECFHAKDKAEGIVLCGEKITSEIINGELGVMGYFYITELRAYENQLKEIELKHRTVTPEFTEILIEKYTSAYLNVNDNSKKEKYSKDALAQARYFPFLDLLTGRIKLYREKDLAHLKR